MMILVDKVGHSKSFGEGFFEWLFGLTKGDDLGGNDWQLLSSQ